MKRLLTSGAMLLCSVLTALAQFSGSGDGTEDSPYRIFDAMGLSQLSNFNGQSGVVFRLMNDVDVSEWITDNNPRQGWTPVGVSATPFQGKLLGEGHKITGLTINRSSESYVGFFGYLSGATISDLTIEGSDVTGGSYVGTFAGYATGSTINNCHVKLSGKVSSSSGSYIGGFVGTASNCTISDFSVEVAVSSTGATYIGGFGGSVSNGITLSNGTVNANVTSSKPYTGGFVGVTETATLADITVTGNINGTTHIGGFIGKSDAVDKLTRCTYVGNLTGQEYAGGISAYLTGGSSSTFTSCFSKGKITVSGDYAGGIVGVSQGGCVAGMESCSHFGDIGGGSYLGGLIGYVDKSDKSPELHTYNVVQQFRVSSGSYSKKTLQTTTETLSAGSSVTAPINNCTVIGNINGNSYIGGLIGLDFATYGYSAETHTASCTFENLTSDARNSLKSYTYLFLYMDGTDTNPTLQEASSGYISSLQYSSATYNVNNTLTYSYNTYQRNTVSMSLTNCSYSGDIQGVDNIGGIVGYKSGGEISKCYSYSQIIGSNNVGGIVGFVSGDKSNNNLSNTTTIQANVANNSVVFAKTNLGRIYGSAESSSANIGALGSTQGNRALVTTKVVKSGILQEVNDDLQNGTSIGASSLKLKATYGALGWNYNNDWSQMDTESYPYKKYQAAPPTITSTLESQATTISGVSVNGGTVYLYYKDKEPVSTVCDGNNWSFTTEPLQSGAQVQVYADAEGMTPSYFTTTNVSYPGLGTEAAPYLIYTADDLQGVNKSGYYKVMNDIDLTSWINENSPTEGWTAIGMNGSEAVYIDGDYHKIKGLWTNTSKDFNGLFSSFLVGQIKNLTVEVASGKKVRGGDYTGILIGRMANAKILNCTIKGDVEGTLHVGGVAGALDNTELNTLSYSGNVSTTSAEAYTGGTTGVATNGSMKSCQVEGNVNGTLYVGGVAGFVSQAELEELTFSGELNTTAEGAFVGGLIGKTETCMLTGGNAMPTITASGNTSYVGGAIGYADGGEVTKGIANDNITASGTGSYVGGLIGYNDAVITLSNANGAVTATGEDSYAGGLVGYATSSVANSYSNANVKGTLYTAGLVAYTVSTIDKCYAKGNVNGIFHGGGVVGYMDGASAATTHSVAMNNTLTLDDQTAWPCRVIGNYGNGCPDPDNSNYALKTMQVSKNGSPMQKSDNIMEGISKTQAELMQASTYAGINWDMTKIWNIDEGNAYPYLLWEVSANPVAEISLDNTTIMIAVGKTATLKATVLPLSASNKKLNWLSDNTNVATVENGVVTAVATGTANITATSTDGSNVSAACKVTVTANKDAAIAELQSLVDRAQSLYDNSTEGEDMGQYAIGSRATLLEAINYVNGRISSTMSDETLAECMNVINEAIATFESQKVTEGEDTDISQIANVMYIEKTEAAAGSTMTLSVKMKNTANIRGFQFDLYLPTGVSVVKSARGKIQGALSADRLPEEDEHQLTFSEQADGAIRFLCGSQYDETFTGSDGEIATLQINIAEEMEDGDYAIILKNVILNETDISKFYETPLVKSTLTITSFMLGDINGDGIVNVLDYTGVANRIHGNTPEGFIEKAADVNEDGIINVLDYTGVANIIHTGSVSGTNSARIFRDTNMREPQ